jgi:hypothetical protein
MINIYCDESCHLENDGNDIMVLGGISCPENAKNKVFEDIRNIKLKHGFSSWFEIKWTKVSFQMIDFYLELIEYFFNNEYLNFRGVVATNKTKLDHEKYNEGSYDIWYYKMYFYLLDPMIKESEQHKILIDIKDTLGGPKVRKLQEVLCNNYYDYNREVIKSIVQINSRESEILQLTDLLIGALTYYNRGMYQSIGGNRGKKVVVESLILNHNVELDKTTARFASKFNLFVWKPREV